VAWPEKIESILSCGVTLHDMGVNNWALTKEQALAAFDKFTDQKISVLGGDVYELVDGSPESNYDNWYCEREGGESLEFFATRSVRQARAYVNNYNNPSGKETFYILVVE